MVSLINDVIGEPPTRGKSNNGIDAHLAILGGMPPLKSMSIFPGYLVILFITILKSSTVLSGMGEASYPQPPRYVCLTTTSNKSGWST